MNSSLEHPLNEQKQTFYFTKVLYFLLLDQGKKYTVKTEVFSEVPSKF